MMDYNRDTEVAALMVAELDTSSMPALLEAMVDEYGRELWRRGRDGGKVESFVTWLRWRAQQPVRVFRAVGGA
jgi:hypothetical protein